MTLDAELNGRVVIVTGAASGIGQGTVARLGAAGAQVVAVDLATVTAKAALCRKMDVTDEAAWQQLVPDVVARFGRIDGMVACAGIIKMAAVVDTSLDDFRRVMQVNVEGVFLGLKHVMPVMLAAGKGSIVNMSSTAGIAGSPMAGAYCASKGAVRLLTKSAALEAITAGSKVRINSVHPALTETPMKQEIIRQLGGDETIEAQLRALMPSGQLVPIDAVVDAIMFLLSDRSLWVNGSETVVDNGFTAQ